MSRKGWRGEPLRHALASKGVLTRFKEHPVYVGGRTSPRFRTFPKGGRTDVYNAFHTTTDATIAQNFVEGEDDKIYKLEIDTSKVPDNKILRAEDWTEKMAKDFHLSGMVYFKHLKETRPDLVEHLKEQGYNRYVSVEMLSNDKPLDVFVYPHFDLPEGLGEKEVAIFDKELLLEAWQDREEATKEEILKFRRNRNE